MSSKITIVKRKTSGFFKPGDIPIIRTVVNDVHDIITNASILVRAYYLDWFEKQETLTINKPLEISDSLIRLATQVIQGTQELKTRQRSDKVDEEKDKRKTESKELFKDFLDVARNVLGENFKVSSEYSSSHILAYSISNLLTAYQNNIQEHFIKYPKRYIKCDLLKRGFKAAEAGKYASIISSNLFYGENNEDDSDKEFTKSLQDAFKAIADKGVSKETYEALFPKLEGDKPHCYQLKCNPWNYLYYMVKINKDLETSFQDVEDRYKRLLNPLPFHSSFVPMHIRIDTSCLCQLLMNKERIDDFKTHYSLTKGTSLNITSKADLLSSFEKIHGRKEINKEEGGTWATNLWDFITNLKSCKQWKEMHGMVLKGKEMVFDNSILTDGVSISFQMIEKGSFGRKKLFEKKKEKTIEEIEEEKANKSRKRKAKKESPEERKPITKTAKLLGCDPGKSDILAITDGATTICYTKKQRQHDCLLHVQRKETLTRRKRNGLDKFESEELSKCCKKSCCLGTFTKYCKTRMTMVDESKKLYRQPYFRQFKFTKHCRTKSSESKMVNRIKKQFEIRSTLVENEHSKLKALTPLMAQNALKGTNELVIGWGNWGKNPNALKGCCPTPGIGIRRRFESFFETITVCEHLTSQTCPCCETERSLKKVKLEKYDSETHHLLRCTNDNCDCRMWNRNVVGSFNILKRFLNEQPPMPETLGNGA